MSILSISFSIILAVCGVALAHDNYAQVLDRKVTLNLRDVSIEKAFREIENAAHVKFVYSTPQLALNENEKITLVANEKKLKDVLSELLAPRAIEYESDNSEFVTLRRNKTKKNKQSSLMQEVTDPAPTVTTQRALVTITGMVTDGTSGQPMAGVNVIVKQTTNGTNTDADGHYTINAENSDVLVFSFIGYKTTEVSVSGRSIIDVSLSEDATSLQEVTVNAGYWDVKERENTGNISKVTAQTISQQPVSNPMSALQGRVPGLYITQSTGVPGSAMSIQIRGRNSISSGGDPLFIIDGIPFTSTSLSSPSTSIDIIYGSNPLNSINAEDIESIEVLKDAGATSIYGARGANGVILITTKKGHGDQEEVNFSVSSGWGQAANFMDVLRTPEYLAMRKEAYTNDDIEPSVGSAPDLLVWDQNRDTDWQKKLIGGTAKTTNAQLRFQGGSRNTSFLATAGYYNETSVFPGDFSYKKFSNHISINHRSANGKFKVTFSNSTVLESNQLPSTDLTSSALLLPPNAPDFIDSEGNFLFPPAANNPYLYLAKKYEAKTDNIISNAQLSYEIVKGLNIISNLGLNRITRREIQTNPLTSFSPNWGYTPADVYSFFSEARVNTWIAEPQLSWSKSTKNGSLNLLIGTTFQQSIRDGETLRGTGYTAETLMESIQAASNISVSQAEYSQYRYAAAFARLNYQLLNKYYINLTGRRDGSSRFGPNLRFANFGAVGLGWIFSNEKSIQSLAPVLSFGKLRMSYGATGNDQIGDYQYLELWAPTMYSYNTNTGLYPARIVNDSYAWEINRKIEVAIELGFIQDKIRLTTSYYQNRSSNQLIGQPLPPSSGFTSIQNNFNALVENKGLEFELNSINIRRNSFSWSTSFNLTIPRNELVSFPGIENTFYNNQYKVGESLGIKKTYLSSGVNEETGLYTIADINDDGSATSSDYVFTKTVEQRYYGGLSNTFNVFGFQIDFLFQFVNQTGYNYLYSPTFASRPGWRTNQPSYVLSRWQNPGDKADVQKFTTMFDPGGLTYTDHQLSDAAIGDASFVRLKNVSISYQLPTQISKKLKMRNAKLFALGQNLITMTDYLGMDPENQNTSSLPPLRVVTIGANITF